MHFRFAVDSHCMQLYRYSGPSLHVLCGLHAWPFNYNNSSLPERSPAIVHAPQIKLSAVAADK